MGLKEGDYRDTIITAESDGRTVRVQTFGRGEVTPEMVGGAIRDNISRIANPEGYTISPDKIL